MWFLFGSVCFPVCRTPCILGLLPFLTLKNSQIFSLQISELPHFLSSLLLELQLHILIRGRLLFSLYLTCLCLRSILQSLPLSMLLTYLNIFFWHIFYFTNYLLAVSKLLFNNLMDFNFSFHDFVLGCLIAFL